jgi:hypothetical protein
MEIVQILRRLWQLRLWVAIAAMVALLAGVASIYKIDPSEPSLKKKSIEYGAASTQLLLDSRKSALTDVETDLLPLVARADAFARLLASPPVAALIAQDAGISPNQLITHGPVLTAQQATRSQREPTAEQRSNDILNEGVGYTLRFSSAPSLPVVYVDAEAPTPQEAVRLANSSSTALQKYVSDLESRQGVAESRRLVISQLGTAAGGTVNKGTDKIVAILTAIGVWIGLCVLILLVSNLARQFRQARALERIGAAPWAEDHSVLAVAGGPRSMNGVDPEDREPASAGS